MSAYETWVSAVDRAVQEIAGVSVHDLADINFVDAFNDGQDPADVAAEILESEGWFS